MEVPGRTNDGSSKDNTKLSSDRGGSIFCQPCSSEGDMAVAIGYCQNCNEFLCSVCLKVHRKQAMSRNHTILDGDNMPKVTLPGHNLDPCSEICSRHESEIIKYYCSAHDVAGCGDCMIIGHKSCKVDRIQDISTEYFSGTEHKDIMKKVEQLVKCMDKMKTDIRSCETRLKRTCAKAVKEVRTFKKEIVDYLDKAEGEMLEIIAKREKEDKDKIHKMKQDDTSISDDILEIETRLNLPLNQANKLFIEAKQVKAKLNSLNERIAKLNEDLNIDIYEFCRSSSISKIMYSRFKLGELSLIKNDTDEKYRHETSKTERVTNADRVILEGKNISEMDAYFDCEINIKLQNDNIDCSVSDCALMSQNQLVVTDCDNKCVKVVDVRNKQVTKYTFNSFPDAIAVVNPNLIALTFPTKNKIQFLEITSGNKVTERNSIKVNNGCYKIKIHEDKIIGITFNKSVEIMKMNGETIKSISHPKLTLLVDIVVVPGSQMFYVSNNKSNNVGVYKFDFDGNLIASYKDQELVGVRGLAVTRDGTVLACNWRKDGSIHVISPDCKKVKQLLKYNKHVNFPRCVAFCGETNKLFIANSAHSVDSKLKNVIKVFQLK